jgi:hypothetical protein
VYLVALAGIALVSWLAVCWLDAPPGARADRLLVLAAYLIGLGYANQMAGVIPAPCLALAVLAHRPRTALRGRLLAACAAAALLGATPFATQPIRAAFHPALNEGEPTACRRGLAWGCTFSRGTWTAFKYNLDRKQYNKGPLADRQAPLTAQVGMWWEYFRWQWLRDPRGERPALQGGVAIAFLALGLAGGWTHWRRHRASWWYFAPLTVLLSLGLVYYMNFKYGATQAPALGDLVPREVRDRDYFFVWSFSAWGVWVALGLVRAWEAATRGGRARRAVLVAATGAVSAAALVPLAANWRSASRRGDHTAIAFARDLLNSVEPHGVLVTGGDNDTFPLWYAQEVERVRPDVTVFLLELLNTDWYVRGLLYRAPRAYDEARGPALYRGLGRALPRRPVLDLTLEQADAVPLYTRVAEPVTLTLGGLRTTLDPARLPQDNAGGGVLLRSDLLLLRMIADTWPERAVYVSRTAGDVAGRLGLGERMLTQGLVRKLVAPDAAHGDVVPSEGGGALDLARTRALWTQVYGFPAALARRGDWADRPSASIPLVYSITGAELAQVLAARGDAATSRRVLADVRTLARASRDEALLAWLAGRGG